MVEKVHHAWIALAWVGLFCGCASGPAPRGEAETHAAFARIQRAEARLDAASRDGEASCDERCEHARDARDAARQICDEARALQDGDALQRCGAAQRQASAVRGTDCACNG